MGWSNQQATTLDGQEFSYTNTTIEFGADTTVTFDDGGAMSANGAPIDIVGGSTLTVDASTFDLTGGTDLDLASGSTIELASGANVTLASGADITVGGLSLPRGIIARAWSDSDLPAVATNAGDPNIAATMLSVTADVEQGRIYHISSPGLSVRNSVAGGTTGVQFTYTEDGSAPAANGLRLVSQIVGLPRANTPQPVPLAATYTRYAASGQLRVLLSIWQIGIDFTIGCGGDHGGNPRSIIELVIEDKGTDPLL